MQKPQGQNVPCVRGLKHPSLTGFRAWKQAAPSIYWGCGPTGTQPISVGRRLVIRRAAEPIPRSIAVHTQRIAMSDKFIPHTDRRAYTVDDFVRAYRVSHAR